MSKSNIIYLGDNAVLRPSAKVIGAVEIIDFLTEDPTDEDAMYLMVLLRKEDIRTFYRLSQEWQDKVRQYTGWRFEVMTEYKVERATSGRQEYAVIYYKESHEGTWHTICALLPDSNMSFRLLPKEAQEAVNREFDWFIEQPQEHE